MRYLQYEKSFSDGRILSYHRVYEVNILNQDSFVFRLGSWTYLENLLVNSTPETITDILIQRPQNQTFDELNQNFLNVLALDPEWSGIIIETSD